MLIQIAGVHDLDEAELIIAAGATHIGLPLRLPDGREDLSESDARALVRAIAGRIETVLITYQTDPDDILKFAAWLGVTGVQLHGAVSEATVARLRELESRVFLLQSLVVQGERVQDGPGQDGPVPRGEVQGDNLRALLQTASRCAPYVDAFITDTYDPRTGRRGATGLTHDWSVSATLVQLIDRPIILAGGITPANVADAVRVVRPAGVDAHTGVEDPRTGRKCPERLRAFVEGAWVA